MSTLVRWSPPAQAEIRHALAQRLERTAMTTAVTELAQVEVGRLYRTVARDTQAVLTRVEAWVDRTATLRPLTPAQHAALQRRTQQFLDEMLALTERAGTELLDTFVQQIEEV